MTMMTNERSIGRLSRPALVRAAAAALIAALATPAWTQTVVSRVPPSPGREVSLAGPRIGLTFLGDGTLARLRENGLAVSSPVSQFGWQFERRLYTNANGLMAVTEWVPLVAGLEQSQAIPSLSWLVGLRTLQGAEFGVGPNLTPAGAGLALAAGVTFRSGALNVPVNVAVVRTNAGARVSVLSGFNLRQ
jgi:hypothetical protein